MGKTMHAWRRHRRLLLAALLAAIPVSAGYAQVPAAVPPAGGGLDARLLGDRILVRVELRTETWLKDTHAVIDFARPTALEINSDVMRSLSWDEDEQALAIVTDGFRIEVPRDGVVLEVGELTKDITARYDNELGQTDVAAIIGWPVLKDYAMRLNLADGRFTLTPGEEADVDQVRSRSSTFVAGVTVFDDRVLIPVSYRGGKAAYMEFATADYHTRIDQPLARAAGKPSGDLDDIYLGRTARSERLSGMAALFPTDLKAERQAAYEAAKAFADRIEAQGGEVPPHLAARPVVAFGEDVLLRTGLSLLAGYDFEINPVRGYFAATRIADSNYSAADAAFYAAAAAASADGLRDYLHAHPADRNVEEAVELLFDLGLDAGASVAEQMAAIDLGLQVVEARRKFVYVAGFLEPLLEPDAMAVHTDLIVAIGEHAMAFVSRAQKPGDRQHIQLLLGDRYLAKGDPHQAWKYFLAAAFNGDPRGDGVTRHELGRAYEALGRHRRAYSSYQRALSRFVGLPPAMAESARAGLERLRPKLDPDDPLLDDALFDESLLDAPLLNEDRGGG